MYAQRPNLETRTKIVATLGPACWDEPVLSGLLAAGVDTVRINCSHSDHAAIRRQVARVRRAALEMRRPAAILLDLQGPKVRTGKVVAPLELAFGDVLTVVMDDTLVGEGLRVGTTYPEMADDVNPGDKVLFADGALEGEVSAVRRDTSPAEVDIRITVGGALGSNKGINLPGVAMSIPSLTEKDRADVAVGLELGVDYVALSFVRKASDIQDLLDVFATLGSSAPIIAKIEKPSALAEMDGILDLADGVMVARGDLGVEVPIVEVPVYQKRIIQAATARGRLVITATQMLDSMERNPRPTRAETTDVANAILDGTDAVMLSGETATGAHPIGAVRTMDAIARSVEASEFFRTRPIERMPPLAGPAGALCRAACMALSEAPRPLVVITWSGETARYMSKLRAAGPIFALSPLQTVVDQLSLVWGVTPVLIPQARSTDDLLAVGERVLVERGHVKKGEEIVVLTGSSPQPASTYFMKVYEVG